MGIKGSRYSIKTELKASNIINAYCSSVLRTKRQNKIYPNTYIDSWECDLLEVTKSGYTHEYEVKVSRSDFKIDSNKQCSGIHKYDVMLSGERVNYFSYICPKGLISLDEIPEWAGLIYAESYVSPIEITSKEKIVFSVVKPPMKLSSHKLSSEIQSRINECIYYRFHLLREKLISKEVELWKETYKEI